MLYAMGSKSLYVDLGCGSSGPGGLLAPDHSVLSLNGNHASVKVDRVLAVIDAPDDVLPTLRAALESAFAKGGPADSMIPGDESSYLSRVLDQVGGKEGESNIACAVALQMGRELVLGAVGGATAKVFRANGELVEFSEDADEPNSRTYVWRTSIEPSDSLILGGREVANHVREIEIRQTIQSSYSVEDAAEWLVTLGAGRGGRRATAVVAKMKQKVDTPVQPVVADRTNKMPSIGPKLRVAGIAVVAALLLVAAVGAGPTLFPSLLKSKGSSATQLRPPTSLKRVLTASHHVQLTWAETSPMPRAGSGYVVRVGHRTYKTKGPMLHLGSSLLGGATYQWKVRAIFGSQRSSWSHRAGFSVPLASAGARPVVIGPKDKATLSAAAKSVRFCWRAAPSATQFMMRLSGNGHHYNQTLPRTAFKHPAPNGTVCLSRSLPAGVSYAWALGAVSPGHYAAWTRWQHFAIASVQTQQPAPTYPTGNQSSSPTTQSSGYSSTPSR